MPALPYPKYGIEHLFLFPIYQTAEAYRKATGEDPPPWNPNKPPKAWFDPEARNSTRRSIVYQNVIAMSPSGYPLASPEGKPMLDVLVLSKEDAGTVNIPPKGPGSTNTPGADAPEVPVPLRPLEPNEELFFDFGGIVAVKNLDLYPQLEIGFTAEDRALLKRIAEKLGL